MKKILTQDSSYTFHNKEYDETYHSISGAVEESIKKFIEPCRIEKLAKQKDQIHILDICFGLGYNSAAAIDIIKKTNPHCKINIIALEKDKTILEEIKNLNPDFRHYIIIQQAAKALNYNHNNINITLMLGDALETIKTLDEKFDAVFLDPFSPKKNPELWTLDFFKDIKKHSHKNTLLATYSCARIVRDNLTAAGFKVKDGPCVGRRSPSTIAALD